MSSSILSVENLSKSYGKFLAVDRVSFELKKGNVYGLLGPNGSGKSSILSMITENIYPSEGSVKWFDEKLPFNQAKPRIGAIINQPQFYPFLSIEKNMEILCYTKNLDKKNIDQYLDRVGLIPYRKKLFQHLSVGLKQRFSIACALTTCQDLLILDEPTNGLDPEGILQIRELIQEIAQLKNTTILLASHLLDEVEKTCSHIIVIKNGKKLYDGSIQSLMNYTEYIEVEHTDTQLLKNTLANSLNIDFQEITPNRLKISACNISAETLNRKLFEHGVILSHLSYKKPQLENLFINLTHSKKI